MNKLEEQIIDIKNILDQETKGTEILSKNMIKISQIRIALNYPSKPKETKEKILVFVNDDYKELSIDDFIFKIVDGYIVAYYDVCGEEIVYGIMKNWAP